MAVESSCIGRETLDRLLSVELLSAGDLILAEVHQGFRNDREFAAARGMLLSLHIVELGGRDIAVQAARNFRTLRKLGVAVRKTIDSVIATRCIESGPVLLYDDADFDASERHLGLRVVAC